MLRGETCVGALALLVAGFVFMNKHTNHAQEWVTHHAKTDDLLPTLATLINLTAQVVLDPLVERPSLSKHLRDFTAILLEIERRYRLEERDEDMRPTD